MAKQVLEVAKGGKPVFIKLAVSDETAEVLEEAAELRKKANKLIAPVIERAQKAAESAFTAPKGKKVVVMYKYGSLSVFAADDDGRERKKSANSGVDIGI